MNPIEYLIPTIFSNNQFSHNVDNYKYFELLFLIIPTILIFYGLYLKKRLPAIWKEETTKLLNNNILDISELSQIIELTQTWKDKFLKSLPGIMLIIGLLGTFWGLGMGISEMTKALNVTNTNVEADLQNSLMVLGIKFKSSLWGIIFNIISRLIFGKIPLQNQKIVSKEVFVKIKEQKTSDDRTKREEITYKKELINYIQKIDNSLNNNKNHLSSKLDNIATLTKENTTSVKNMEKSNENATKSLENAIVDFKNTTMKLELSISSFSQEIQKSIISTNEMIKSTKTFINESKDAIQNSVNTLKGEISKSLKDFSINVTVTLDKISGELKETTNAIKSAINSSMDKVEKATKDSSILISNATGGLANQIKDMSDKLISNLADIDSIMQQSNKATKDLVNLTARLNSIIEELGATNSKQADASLQISKSFASLSKDFNQTLSILDDNNKNANDVALSLNDILNNTKQINHIINKRYQDELN